MSSRLIQLLLGLSLLLNCFVLAGFVYRSWIAPPTFDMHLPPPPPPPPPGGRPSPVEALVRDLDLDPGQHQKLKDMLDRYAAARRERLREIQQLREQTAAELRRPQIDTARVDVLVEQVARLRADQQKENLRIVSQLEPQLRPDQRERFHTIVVDRLLGPPPRPPGGPAGPGGRGPGPGFGPGPGQAPGPNPGRPLQ